MVLSLVIPASSALGGVLMQPPDDSSPRRPLVFVGRIFLVTILVCSFLVLPSFSNLRDVSLSSEDDVSADVVPSAGPAVDSSVPSVDVVDDSVLGSSWDSDVSYQMPCYINGDLYMTFADYFDTYGVPYGYGPDESGVQESYSSDDGQRFVSRDASIGCGQLTGNLLQDDFLPASTLEVEAGDNVSGYVFGTAGSSSASGVEVQGTFSGFSTACSTVRTFSDFSSGLTSDWCSPFADSDSGSVYRDCGGIGVAKLYTASIWSKPLSILFQKVASSKFFKSLPAAWVSFIAGGILMSGANVATEQISAWETDTLPVIEEVAPKLLSADEEVMVLADEVYCMWSDGIPVVEVPAQYEAYAEREIASLSYNGEFLSGAAGTTWEEALYSAIDTGQVPVSFINTNSDFWIWLGQVIAGDNLNLFSDGPASFTPGLTTSSAHGYSVVVSADAFSPDFRDYVVNTWPLDPKYPLSIYKTPVLEITFSDGSYFGYAQRSSKQPSPSTPNDLGGFMPLSSSSIYSAPYQSYSGNLCYFVDASGASYVWNDGTACASGVYDVIRKLKPVSFKFNPDYYFYVRSNSGRYYDDEIGLNASGPYVKVDNQVQSLVTSSSDSVLEVSTHSLVGRDATYNGNVITDMGNAHLVDVTSPDFVAPTTFSDVLTNTGTVTTPDTAPTPDSTTSDGGQPIKDVVPAPDTSTPDPAQTEEKMNPKFGDLTKVFPFCLPWDLYTFVNLLAASPVAPTVSWPVSIPGSDSSSIALDLSPYDDSMRIIRDFEIVVFCVGLILITRNIIRG